jgi:hypothetical protein
VNRCRKRRSKNSRVSWWRRHADLSMPLSAEVLNRTHGRRRAEYVLDACCTVRARGIASLKRMRSEECELERNIDTLPVFVYDK